MPSSHICLSITYLSMHRLATYPLSSTNYSHVICHLPTYHLSSVYHLSNHPSKATSGDRIGGSLRQEVAQSGRVRKGQEGGGTGQA